MNKSRMQAYRWLLHEAMLAIRGLQWLDSGWRQRLSPSFWRSFTTQAQIAGAIADWLHNLASYSAIDFYGFNEDWFWKDYKGMLSRYPNAGLERYRLEFERRATPIPPRDHTDVITNAPRQ